MWRRKRGSEHDEDPFDLGVAAWQSTPRDIDAARHWWERAAEAGDTRAMNALGLLYAAELEQRDTDTARHWFRKAAEKGNPYAAYQLGVLAASSDPPDHENARVWWQRAADAGHVMAMGCLGDLYAARFPPDRAMSRHWWERAAEGGLGEAMYRLGTVAMNEQPSDGLDVTMSWYLRAAETGHAGAMFALGTLYEGLVDPPDLEAARTWFRRAVDAGYEVAAKSLEALTATWTTSDGWGETPPTTDQIRAMADWLDRHDSVFDELSDGTEPAMDAIVEALLARNVPALRSACVQAGRLFAHGLGSVTPTPDADLTEAVRLLADAGERLSRMGAELSDHPVDHDVQPVQGCVADIGWGLDRMMSIYLRDREIVESGDG